MTGRTFYFAYGSNMAVGVDLRPLDWYKEHVLRGARALQLP